MMQNRTRVTRLPIYSQLGAVVCIGGSEPLAIRAEERVRVV